MTQYKVALFILLICITPGLSAQNKSHSPNISGKWVSKGDPNYTLLVKNGWIYEYHKNSPGVDSFRYDITSRPCSPGKPIDKKGLFLHKKKQAGGDEYCYKLLSYSSNAFVITAGSNGATYHFIHYLKRY